MKFNRLRLTGFKSFVDASEMIIEPGLTGVVGPNGCGKSNLLEALRWVMGENSFKNMRGTGMEDVIFSGTAGRPARNMAEVVLVLDNSDRSAPAAYNESDVLEVSRKIERDHGSTYRVNGREVRARDVQLMFADASTGSHSPALVRQGQIGQLISSKPISRRRILEEAAGITGLHTRRHEAELRLKAAETNLTRLDDVVAQIETQLSGLKRQARQATRYRNLSGYVREAEAIVLHLKWRQAADLLSNEENRLEATDQKVGELTREAAATTTAQTAAAEKLPDLRDKEAATAAALHRLTVARENLDAEEARAREEAQRLTDRLEQIAQDLAREREQVSDTQRALDRLNDEEQEINNAQEAQAQTGQEAEARVGEAERIMAAAEQALDQLNEELAALLAQRGSLERTINDGGEREERFTRQLGEIAQERGSLSEGETQKVDIANRSQELADKARQLELAAQAAQDAEEGRRAAQAAETQAREPMQQAEQEVAQLAAEAKTLAGLLKTDEQDLWPPMIDAVSVEPGYEKALGAALGDDLTIPSDTSAPVHWDQLPPLENPAPLPFGVTALSQVVRGPQALARRLSQIGIVSADQGKALQSKLAPGQRLVSREGALWRWDGYTAGADAPTSSAKRLEQRNRLEELEQEISVAQTAAQQARSLFEAARVHAEEAAALESQLRVAQRDAQSAHDQLRASLSEAERAASATLSRLATLADAEERLKNDLQETQTQLTQSRQTLGQLPGDDALRSRIGEARDQVAALRVDLTEARAAYESLRREAEARVSRLQVIGQEHEAWTSRATNSAQQIATLENRAEAAEGELAKLKNVPAEIETKRSALLTQLGEAETARSQAADALEVAEQELAACDAQAKRAQAALSEVREERARIDGLVDGARERQRDAEARIGEVLNCQPEQALEQGGLKEGAELPDLETIEAKLERLKRERENLGGVNLRADEEAQELTEQLDGMNSEREDLEAAISKLRQAISSLNREGRERLLAAFETVNENFGRLFTHLFGGGEAHLKLTESEDPLEAGLEIMARPPGKRLQVMSLLSGGEQALTAMSLIFAVFLTNPSPICVLDEVDAPLDDANVERFCDLMEEMTRTTDTKFLIITHHALTMARMNRLFGVTMQERGVSTLVSVDLEAAEQLREAS